MPWTDKIFPLIIGLWIGALITGCAARPPAPEPDIQNRPLPELDQPTANARTQADFELTRQARQLLAREQPDQAIQLLERAVNLDPSGGQKYYFLAQAWLMKGDYRQALEFNHLAGIYLSDDHEWEALVDEQLRQIVIESCLRK